MRLEFRIPISPTERFFSQVRFFDFCLRRLGPAYRNARIVVVVGDHCDIDEVKALNRWSQASNLEWVRVPDAIFETFGIHGTANWRFFPPAEQGDLIILSDADTVLLRDIDPLFSFFDSRSPAIAGHMAHFEPPGEGFGDLPSPKEEGFWPALLRAFGVAMPDELYEYSIDIEQTLPKAPPYFNLGFVALNPAALDIFRDEIFSFETSFKARFGNNMRCQIACTVIAHRHNMAVRTLGAEYNMANDERHLQHSGLHVGDIRVVHYLRTEEINRGAMLLPENIRALLSQKLDNPINSAVQELAREYADHLGV